MNILLNYNSRDVNYLIKKKINQYNQCQCSENNEY